MKTGIIRSLVPTATIILASACCRTADPSELPLALPLDDSAWNESSWISVVDAPVVTDVVYDGHRAADGASWFVSKVKNDQKVVSAKWMTTSLGVHEIHVNGHTVGAEILKPGFTHYAKTKLSFTYDITDIINKGKGAENVFSAQVTPGWWADKIITPAGHSGMLGKKCAFRGVLELTYADGSTKIYGTNTNDWKAGIAGPVKHAAIFDGEVYDARIAPGYATPEVLSTPEVNTEFQGNIYPSNGAEIYLRDDIALAPVKAYVWKNVEGKADGAFGKVVIEKEFSNGEDMVIDKGDILVVDFGQNTSAVPSFIFNAAEGTTLHCEFGELLNDGNGDESRGMDGPEGSVHRLNLRIPNTGMMLDYTFASSDKPVGYTPTRTFFGYRYASITADGKVTINDIKSVPVTSMTPEIEIGTITTGNDLINKLISNTLWGHRSNYLSVPTDCPQRNERLGWTADTQVYAEAGTFFADTRSFFHKWLRDLRDSQGELGGYPSVAPFAQYGNETMRLGWSDCGVIVPWIVWKQFGDSAIVEESWDSMTRYMDHIARTQYLHEAHVQENGYSQYADWLSYEPLEATSGTTYMRDAKGNSVLNPDAVEYWNYLSQSYWCIDALMMMDMARSQGWQDQVEKYEAMSSQAKSVLISRYLNDDGGFKTEIFNTMQTPALFALKNGLVEGEAKQNMIARLRENFASHGNCLQTGFLGTSILMPTLTENGMVDIAYELLFQRKNPSWLYSVDNGATTIWERWNSYMKESGMGPRGMNSFNHYAYGVVCEWIWETVAGIAADPSAPGFKRIIMKPVPDKRLGHVDAQYNSAAGVIKSSWRYEGDKCIWNFSIPEGSIASVTLPGESQSKEFTSGSYTVEF